MAKLSSSDLQDIVEYIVCNVDQYFEDYSKYGSYLPFADYVQNRIATLLNYRFNHLDITEAFENDKVQAIMDFHSQEQDEEKEIKVH